MNKYYQQACLVVNESIIRREEFVALINERFIE